MEHFLSLIARRVDRGAALLDRYVPGWEGRINLNTLDLTHETNCVVAQAMGCFYSDAVSKLTDMGAAVSTSNASVFGFNNYEQTGYGPHERWCDGEELTKEWTHLIANRLRAVADEPLANWEKELLGGSTVTFTTIDGRTVSFDNVIVDSVGNGAMEQGVIGFEFADGSDRVIHVPFVSHWEFTH